MFTVVILKKRGKKVSGILFTVVTVEERGKKVSGNLFTVVTVKEIGKKVSGLPGFSYLVHCSDCRAER